MKYINKLIRIDSRTYPHFLSDQFLSHISAMENLASIFRTIEHLDQKVFLDDETTLNVAKFIKMKLDQITDTLDIETGIKCVDYVRYRTYVYRQHWLREECYEQLQNLDKTLAHIFKVKNHIV